MPRIRVEPLGIEVEAATGETVLDAVNAAGYFWPVGCAKNGECTNCAMEVVSGVGRLSRMGRFERQNLIRQRGPRSIEDPRLRLACQAHLEGDVIVHKNGVRLDGVFALSTENRA
ncbi:MAG TPA: 2Fe-2S iron-sulfur cluster binding domain-containing protein [Tepidiformaceae bacterium]|nr:2Fe-2S iron-sulfur cluster binding domain-containing protein [Tepidiformaceae bacterium]